jgi:hypothetical protein
MNGKPQTKIRGAIIAETEKAVRIQFNSGKENWIPKSTIKSPFIHEQNREQEFSIDTWVLEKNNISTTETSFIDGIIQDIITTHAGNLIALYGIGSFFDKTLPETWIKNDIDLIIIVKSIENIPKTEWENRFYSKQIDSKEVFFGYNSLEMLTNKDIFLQFSGANYEWALIEMKHPDNSALLYGKDIRGQLPEINDLTFDYDDILARGIYHLEKSLKGENDALIMRELSKAIFKTAFYLCVYFVESFRFTSLVAIEKKLEDIIEFITPLKPFKNFFEEAKLFRTTRKFSMDYEPLRNKFINYLFSLLRRGILHRKIEGEELDSFLAKYFGGFPVLKRYLKRKSLAKN